MCLDQRATCCRLDKHINCASENTTIDSTLLSMILHTYTFLSTSLEIVVINFLSFLFSLFQVDLLRELV